jgi:transposase
VYKQVLLESAPQNLTPEQLFQKQEAALSRIALLEERNLRLDQRNLLLEEKIRLLLLKKYGSGAETLSDAQLTLLELEPGVCAAEVAAEAALSPEDKALAQQLLAGASSGKKRNRPVRAPLPQNLERKERTIHVPAKDCVCSQCGEAKKLIGYETSERLASKPVEFYVEVTKREKLACSRCEEMGVSTAPVPATIIEKGILADNFVVETVLKKFEDHQPLYRQAVGIQRDAQIEVSQATLSSSVIKVGELLFGVVELLRGELLSGAYIQAHETTVSVQSERTKGKNHQAYLWVYSLPGGAVVYDFQMGRSREGPAHFLVGFEARLQSDGYAAYGKIGGPGLLHFGCWAHVRRKFMDASKLDVRDARSVAVVGAIGKLYELERVAREGGLTHLEREALRLKECPALLASLKALITQSGAGALPKSALGRACSYALNWIQIGSEGSGPKVAAILSVLATCKRLGIKARDYLLEVLPQLSYRATRPWVEGLMPLEELTPGAWQRARAKADETLA